MDLVDNRAVRACGGCGELVRRRGLILVLAIAICVVLLANVIVAYNLGASGELSA